MLTEYNNISAKNVIKCLKQLNHSATETIPILRIMFCFNRTLILFYFCFLKSPWFVKHIYKLLRCDLILDALTLRSEFELESDLSVIPLNRGIEKWPFYHGAMLFKTMKMKESDSENVVTVITKLLREYLSDYYYLKVLQVVAL